MVHSNNKNTGALGEKIALNYLLSINYELITSNYSTRFGEIDLIMRDKDRLVFVEVKTKKGLGWGRPEEMFTRNKYRKVKNMATVYLEGREVKSRIDMVAVVLGQDNEPVSVKYYENVTGMDNSQ